MQFTSFTFSNGGWGGGEKEKKKQVFLGCWITCVCVHICVDIHTCYDVYYTVNSDKHSESERVVVVVVLAL